MEAKAEDACEEMLAVWDFDWSLVNENSDTFLPEAVSLDLHHWMKSQRSDTPWTTLVDSVLVKGQQEYGLTEEGIADKLGAIPFMPGMKKALGLQKDLKARMAIISDANDYFIESILRAKGLQGMFQDVHTNVLVKEDGLLRLKPYHRETAPHGCKYCPPNLCKSLALKAVLRRWDGKQRPRIVYVGDGGGDLCPCIQVLQPGDLVLCRKGFSLEKKLKSRKELKPQMAAWVDAEELHEHLAKWSGKG